VFEETSNRASESVKPRSASHEIAAPDSFSLKSPAKIVGVSAEVSG